MLKKNRTKIGTNQRFHGKRKQVEVSLANGVSYFAVIG